MAKINMDSKILMALTRIENGLKDIDNLLLDLYVKVCNDKRNKKYRSNP